jgi:ABC-type transport system involved in cytochrome c biogenesis permease subunit
LRQALPLQHPDEDALNATVYPLPGSTDLEVFYNRLNPFFWSWVLSLAATLCMLAAVLPLGVRPFIATFRRKAALTGIDDDSSCSTGRRTCLFGLGVTILPIAQVFAVTGLGLRGIITGLVPLTGMFETVIFVSIYAALLGLWFALLPTLRRPFFSPLPLGEGLGVRADAREKSETAAQAVPGADRLSMHASCDRQSSSNSDDFHQRRLFALAGAIVSFITAVLAYYAPATVMHRHIGSVTPILRDNFWLAVHVVTIMASYASAAIALILGNIALGYYLFGRYTGHRSPEACAKLAGLMYRTIQITVLLLTIGTILGALWADQAWGRFWGWDPKETWALISLLVYILILHARCIGWSGDFGMATAAVLGATSVLFTWYGVNFLLNVGLHSYGSGAGGQWAVGSAVALQWLFWAAAAGRHVSASRDER